MTEDDIRIGFLNMVTLMVSFTNIEAIFRIGLIAVSIIYTGFKLYDLIKKRK